MKKIIGIITILMCLTVYAYADTMVCDAEQQRSIDAAVGYRDIGQPILGVTATLASTGALLINGLMHNDSSLEVVGLISTIVATAASAAVATTSIIIDERIDYLRTLCDSKYHYICPNGEPDLTTSLEDRPDSPDVVSCVACGLGYTLYQSEHGRSQCVRARNTLVNQQ